MYATKLDCSAENYSNGVHTLDMQQVKLGMSSCRLHNQPKSTAHCLPVCVSIAFGANKRYCTRLKATVCSNVCQLTVNEFEHPCSLEFSIVCFLYAALSLTVKYIASIQLK